MKIMSENEGAGDLTYDGADNDDINPNDSVSNVGKHSKCHQ